MKCRLAANLQWRKSIRLLVENRIIRVAPKGNNSDGDLETMGLSKAKRRFDGTLLVHGFGSNSHNFFCLKWSH